jgi:hypothetical protein
MRIRDAVELFNKCIQERNGYKPTVQVCSDRNIGREFVVVKCALRHWRHDS